MNSNGSEEVARAFRAGSAAAQLRERPNLVKRHHGRVVIVIGDPDSAQGHGTLDPAAGHADSSSPEPECLSGMLSHEIRTPLTVIIGNAQLLRSRGLVLEAGRDLLADIEQEAERIAAIVEDLRVVSRGSADLHVETEPILLQRVLPAIVAKAALRLPAATVALEMDPDLPAVEADLTLCGQIVTNLVSNAAKYAGSSPHVRLRVEASDDSVTIACQDDGPGFPPEALERAFEVFYRAPSTARRVDGAGVGLYVVLRLVRAMGGDATCENAPSGGALVTVRLPRAAPDPEPLWPEAE